MSSLKSTLYLSRGVYGSLSISPLASSSRQPVQHFRNRSLQHLQPILQSYSQRLDGTSRRWNTSQSSAIPATSSRSAKKSETEKIQHEEHDHDALRIHAPLEEGRKPQQIGQIEPRLSLTFTCTANECGHRSTHEFAKRSYEKGIVLVQCPSCKSRHLIADHIGWFKESTEEGTLKTVEDLLRAKGETIRKGKVNFDGDIEYAEES